jgi:hypothetical protein
MSEYLHAYEKLSLGTAGVVMGLVLLLLHGIALLKPEATKKALCQAATNIKAAQNLLVIDFVWIFLLLLDAEWNPLKMNLFDFNKARGILLVLCPVVCGVLLVYNRKKELLFPRALGLFLLLMALVPLTAAFLKDPVTRLLIPCWWYPVLTIAMFWVAKPYLFRDQMEKLTASPRLYTIINGVGAAWGAAILVCAIAFWY